MIKLGKSKKTPRLSGDISKLEFASYIVALSAVWTMIAVSKTALVNKASTSTCKYEIYIWGV